MTSRRLFGRIERIARGKWRIHYWVGPTTDARSSGARILAQCRFDW